MTVTTGLWAALAFAGAAYAVTLPQKKPWGGAAVVETQIVWRDAATVLPQRKPAGWATGPVLTAQAAPVSAETVSLSVPLPVRKPQVAAIDKPQVAAVSKPQVAAVPVAAEPVKTAEATIPVIRIKADDDSFLISRLLDRYREGRRLSEEDAARYTHIFAFQDNAEFAKADTEIARLSDTRLIGHVLFQRYTNPAYKTSWQEAAAWMEKYADHPNAGRVHDIALQRRPDGARLAAPRPGRGIPGFQDFDVGQLGQSYLSGRLPPRQRDIAKDIQRMVSESPTAALRRLDDAKGQLDVMTYDALRAEIAQSYFYNGKFDKAYANAAKSSDRAKEELPLAGWIAGLSAWRSGDYVSAAKYFARAANSKRSSAWMASAGAHWAARSHLRARRPEEVSYWLARAAEYPRTFYGIISLKALGLEQARFDWDVPTLSAKHLKALAAAPAGRRALALIDAGNAAYAAAELRQLNPGEDPVMQEAMVALAAKAGIPEMQLRMGSAFREKDGGLFDAALYPDAPWAPRQGFSVDRALVYAFIRQESKFDPSAYNRSSGAVGLMQLMPATAAHVAKMSGEKLSPADIKDPTVNIDLGQKYLNTLLQDPSVAGNLFKLAVAYNAGPGKLARWEKQVNYRDDPLLFIESIPVAETRIFVERVMTNFWIYRIKYGQDTESLDSVVEGAWPVYTAQDIRRGGIFAEAATFFAR